jgi:hypothetical protein
MIPKDKILFYLRRRVRELESETPSHESMAMKGYSYEQRDAALKQATERAAKNKDEVEALTEAILLVEKHGA